MKKSLLYRKWRRYRADDQLFDFVMIEVEAGGDSGIKSLYEHDRGVQIYYNDNSYELIPWSQIMRFRTEEPIGRVV